MPNRPTGAARQLVRIACLALPIVGVGTFATSEARADFRVCNDTQSLVGVAIGYRSAEGWVSEGWWRIPAQNCRSVVEGDLSSRFYYLYAEDSEGVGRWGGEVNLCIAENEFKVVGVQDCFARGFQEMGFREYDTGSQASWMVQLAPTARDEDEPVAPAAVAPAAPATADNEPATPVDAEPQINLNEEAPAQ